MNIATIDDVETCEELLRRWDNGDSVWSVEMGGLGPSYEQCIQITAMEMLRWIISNPPDKSLAIDGNPINRKAWYDYSEKLNEGVSSNPVIKTLGLSGAQAGAAESIAMKWITYGYKETMKTAPKDRLIQVCKNFPQG